MLTGEEKHKPYQAAPGKSSASLSSLVLHHSWGVIVLITAYIERLDVTLHDPRVCAESEDLCLFINHAHVSKLSAWNSVSNGFEVAFFLVLLCDVSEGVFCGVLFYGQSF